ncbi:hypothetical protein [Verminephrobacter aporrectodeae]|uniref:hypothetical protein n=1 Tax=Verminephrobacter aporrectodeae TaxID=1110389 RepID=UPI0022373026|nr:hypothetical protein [Verminephrobacter aporrectodeae]
MGSFFIKRVFWMVCKQPGMQVALLSGPVWPLLPKLGTHRASGVTIMRVTQQPYRFGHFNDTSV